MLIVGLGNPGGRYKFTRHNVGFMVVDNLISILPVTEKISCESSLVWKLAKEIYVAQPQTYMNRSGAAVAALVKKLGVPIDKTLIVYDDMDLPLGRIRLRCGGGSGGHNGINSIIQQLGVAEFHRLRIGIGRPYEKSVIDYVLSPFQEEDSLLVNKVIKTAVQAAVCWSAEGLETAMNKFNNKAPDAIIE